MDSLKFSERVDFTYFMGAGISLLFFIISMNFYNGEALPFLLYIPHIPCVKRKG